MKLGVLFTGLMLIALDVSALDQKELSFAPVGGGPDVKMVFKGEILRPTYDVMKASGASTESVKPFTDFFRVMYQANLSGKKDSILALWNPSEIQTIAAAIDDKTLGENTLRFKSLESLKLNMVVEYGKYYICFLETNYGAQGAFVMKFTVVKNNGKLLLTNALNGDYFYDNISHFMDKTNFTKKVY